MDSPELPHDLPDSLAAGREELRRRSRAERIRPIWLWIGNLTGLVAFAAVRTASVILLPRDCANAGSVHYLGLTPAEIATASITFLGALATIAAGLLSWQIWRRTSLPEDEVSTGNMPRVPFWALGGMLLSGFSLIGILLMGGLALAIGTGCP